MEADSLPRAPGGLRGIPIARWTARRPDWAAAGVVALLALLLIALEGLHDVAQTGLNGLTLGSIYALGAVGLTLVYHDPVLEHDVLKAQVAVSLSKATAPAPLHLPLLVGVEPGQRVGPTPAAACGPPPGR
jgi:hypothetical protein